MNRLHLHRAPALALAGVLAAILLGPATAAAHGPDPLFGSRTWNPSQVVGYSWASGEVPPAWMAPAIDAGAGDVGESRGSRAATFVRTAGAPSTIAYGVVTPCPAYGIACVDRTGVPTSFAGMWFRPHGWAYDWGTLRWCQAQATFTDGCFDVETLTLDELGHVEILGHHANYDDGSDYTDSVVQAISRARPRAGWNQHAFGVCDVARLQLEYELISPANPVSTCLSLPTAISFSASPTAVYLGGSVSFSAILRVTTDTTNNRAMSGDWLSNRTILLQRRTPGTTAWTTVTTLTPSASSPGLYGGLWSPTSTYDWRVQFATPSTEGLLGAASATVRITVSGCTGAGCPSRIVVGPAQ